MHRKAATPPQSAQSILLRISEVIHNPTRERFELWVAGDLVGVLGYRLDREQRTATVLHTVLYDEYSGHGLATRLTGGAMAFMRDHNLRVQPLCSFTRHYLTTHPGAATLAPA